MFFAGLVAQSEAADMVRISRVVNQSGARDEIVIKDESRRETTTCGAGVKIDGVTATTETGEQAETRVQR